MLSNANQLHFLMVKILSYSKNIRSPEFHIQKPLVGLCLFKMGLVL